MLSPRLSAEVAWSVDLLERGEPKEKFIAYKESMKSRRAWPDTIPKEKPFTSPTHSYLSLERVWAMWPTAKAQGVGPGALPT